MPVSDAFYSDWLLDVTRNAHRTLLVKLNYAGGETSSANTRTDQGATLGNVGGFTVRNFSSSDCILYIRSAGGATPDYYYEIWVNGSVIGRIEESDEDTMSIRFRVQPQTTIKVSAVVIDESTGAYGRPWSAELYVSPTQNSSDGASGSWQDLGANGLNFANVGTVRLGSLPYMTDDGLSFDDFLIGRPEIEDQLDDFRGVGDLIAINPDTSVDWLSLSFRGYQCQWLHGDETWPLDDFRPIASALIDDCTRIDGSRYRFNLVDGGQHLRRAFTGIDLAYAGAATGAIEEIINRSGLPVPTFVNIPGARNFSVKLGFDSNSIAGDTIRRVANSIRAHVRVAQDGRVEIFRPETSGEPALVLTEDDISEGGIRMLESTRVYKRVRLDYSDDKTVYRTTNALTGELDEEITIDTVIRFDSHANLLADEYAEYYSVRHPIWQLRIFDAVNRAQKGEYIGVDHPELVARGVVRRVLRAPLSPWSIIEVEV